MKNVKIQKLKPIIGILIMIFTFVIILIWENYGRYNLLYTNTIELKVDVEPGTIITEDMLTVGTIDKYKIVGQPVTTNYDVVGKISKNLIPKGIQLDKRFFDTKDLSIKKGQYVFKVPTEWIVAVPSSIRRGDTAYFYEIDSQTAAKITGNQSETSNTQTSNNQAQDKNQIKQIESESIPGIKNQLGNILLSSMIVYVKDSANREVITVSKEVRFDGSSQVSEIEIIASIEEVEKLKNSINNGNKFIILY